MAAATAAQLPRRIIKVGKRVQVGVQSRLPRCQPTALVLQETQRLLSEPGIERKASTNVCMVGMHGSADPLLCCDVAAPGISASPSEDNLRYFNVMILGPQSSPYEGVLCVWFWAAGGMLAPQRCSGN